MIISLDTHKTLDKIKHHIMLKGLVRSEIQGICLNILKAIGNKPIANMKFNEEKLEAIPLKSGTRQGCPLSIYSI